MFFVISSPFCYVLPCFATGCHAFGLKIATAALRPRNDTKSGRFCLENGRFLFYAVVFCAVSLRIVFQTFRSGNCSVFDRFVPEIVPFSRKTHQICHCEEGAAFAPDAAIFNESTCHPGTNYGCAERNRTLEGRERKRNDAADPFFVIGIPFCFVLPCFVPGCHAFSFKIATAAMRPRNDTKTGRFCLEKDVFHFCGRFFRGVALHRFSNVSFRKLFRFPAKPVSLVIARRARAPDAAIFNETICHPGTNYGCA